MRWVRVRPEEERLVRDFLAEREAVCASAASRFREMAARGLGPEAPGTAWAGLKENADGSRAVESLIVLFKAGLVSVIFSETANPANRRALARILAARKISSLQGLREDVALAEKAIERSFKPFSRGYIVDPIDYTLMSLDREPSLAALSAGPAEMAVRQAFPPDAELLFPLQAAYELEEVVPAGGSFSAAAARLSFERALGERLILYAVVDGKAVGKAGTNASAYAVDQIGGVYVLPEYRGKGIARRLVAELASRLRNGGRGAVLFVKKRNESARKAYESVGFEPGPDYRITYYTEKRK